MGFDALPYPLYNAVTYLQRKISPERARSQSGEAHPRGLHSPDYFLFSPMMCGARTTGYVSPGHDSKVYGKTSLADAVTCSAASLAPLMHGDSNRLAALGLLIANLNLSSWLPNPNPAVRGTRLAFWPYRYLKMVFGRLNETSPFIPIADGAFGDNLGMMELLRRRAELIVCVDSTLDPNYTFSHLRNLIVRARSEEDVVISLPKDALARIKPSPLTGFAETQFVVGDVHGPGWKGRIVYVKACLRAPFHGSASGEVEPDAADYQTYHARFPQESTADQFFDPPQWRAYNALGRQLALAVLEEFHQAVATPTSLSKADRRTLLLRCFEGAPAPVAQGAEA